VIASPTSDRFIREIRAVQHRRLWAACVVAASVVVAQDPQPAPPTAPAAPAPASAPQDAAAKGEAVRYALVEADGGKRLRISAAMTAINESSEVKSRFLAARKRIAVAENAASRAAAPRPTSAPASRPDAAAVPKTATFDPATKALLDAAVGPDDAAGTAALAKLAGSGEAGSQALAQLSLRSETLVARLMSASMRKQMDSNAIYEGQFAELKVYGVDAVRLLLGWTMEPPKDVPEERVETFKTAAVRALRDVGPEARHMDAVKNVLREAAGRASQAGNEDLLFTTAGVLRRFGDAVIFDAIKEQAGKAAAAPEARARRSGFKALADLHYAVGDHQASAEHYQKLVAVCEELKEPPAQIAINYYNAACNFALCKKADEGFAMLTKAVEAGAKTGAVTLNLLKSDRDIAILREDPRFAKLIETHFPTKP
jgi:hypothetical protein